MPKKQKQESEAEQGARFVAEVERLIAAGELSPTEADEMMERFLDASVNHRAGAGVSQSDS
jgi:hypothetical protein